MWSFISAAPISANRPKRRKHPADDILTTIRAVIVV
jgi:hypothetical protein